MSISHLMVADAVGDLHRKHGFWRVAAALLVSAMHGRHKANSLHHLDARMLKDIGVEPSALRRWDLPADDLLRPDRRRAGL